MKNQLYGLIVITLLTFTVCQPPSNEQSSDLAAAEESKGSDYAAFEKKAETLRAFFKAHGDEDLEAQKAMISDTLRWSPPYYNDNEWLGKEDWVAALQTYHNDYENIEFQEGDLDGATGGTITNGIWSGSVFPENEATNSPDVIRSYGTWTATHTETGKDIGVKYFALVWINDDAMIAGYSEYFDVHGLAAQLAEE